MLKICHITSVHPRYDIRIFIKECVTLAQANYCVSLIVADGKQDEINQGVHIYSVERPKSRRYRMLHTSQQIYQKILTLNPGVIHFHDPELMLMALKLRHKYKIIYDVHEDVPKQLLNKPWLPKLFRPLIAKLILYVEQYCARRYTAIITATPIISKRFARYNSHVQTVCNYPIINMQSFDNTLAIRHNKLCYIGSISRSRGIVPLVQSLAISKMTLELAGPFSDDITLEQLQAFPGREYVNYLGILTREQINNLLSTVSIGIVTLLATPSYKESLPIKMFEYMYAGVPVIGSDFVLWREIILQYQCGMLVEPTDSEAIAQMCIYLTTNLSIAQNMGQNGRNAVIQHFNWQQESTKLLELYNRLSIN